MSGFHSFLLFHPDPARRAAVAAAAVRMSASKRVRTILDSLDSALDASISHQPAATPLPGTRSSLAAASPVSPFSMSQGSLFSIAAGSPFAIEGSALAAPAEQAAPKVHSLKDLEAMIEPEAAFGTSVTCRPHSVADLHDRLATFSNAQAWFCKPSAVSPLECARAGWEIDGTDMLACRVQPALPHAPHWPMPAHAPPRPFPARARAHPNTHTHTGQAFRSRTPPCRPPARPPAHPPGPALRRLLPHPLLTPA